MKQQKTWPFFLIALFFALTSLFPLSPFAPYLAILYRRSTWIKALWVATGCGCLLDLLSSLTFGTHPLQMILTTSLLYRLHIYFIDKPIGLASYTALISLTLTLMARLLLTLHGSTLPFTFQGLVTDFILMPLVDALYAFFFFACPPLAYRLIRKGYFYFLFLKKKRLESNSS